MLVVVIICQLILLVISLVRQYQLERRLSRIESSIVIQVMEEGQNIADRVLVTYKVLCDGMMGSSQAMREARRLHGLDKSSWFDF